MPAIPTSTSLLSLDQIYIELLACDERAQHCHSFPVLRKAQNVFFFFFFMNALTVCGYASLVRHWRRWCHLSARVVMAQGVYCCSKVSHLKCHSRKDKWQDAAPCTCSGKRKLFGPRHIIITDPGKADSATGAMLSFCDIILITVFCPWAYFLL